MSLPHSCSVLYTMFCVVIGYWAMNMGLICKFDRSGICLSRNNLVGEKTVSIAAMGKHLPFRGCTGMTSISSTQPKQLCRIVGTGGPHGAFCCYKSVRYWGYIEDYQNLQMDAPNFWQVRVLLTLPGLPYFPVLFHLKNEMKTVSFC